MPDVLAPAFLRKLKRMRLSVRRAFGTRQGNRPTKSSVSATGIELERYKTYDPGDELRFVDWNAFARLDRLLVKRFRAEREAPLYVFVDTSASMGAPEQDSKFGFGIDLALSLSYIAVRKHDPVRLVLLGDQRNGHGYLASPVIRLPKMMPRLVAFCNGLEPRGSTPLASGIPAFLHTTRTPGVAVVISDFLIGEDVWRPILRLLSSRGFEVAALRPLGTQERAPSRLFRRGRLIDVETGDQKVISLSPRNSRQYQQALREQVDHLGKECIEQGAIFAVCDTALGLDHCLFTQLPQLGLVH